MFAKVSSISSRKFQGLHKQVGGPIPILPYHSEKNFLKYGNGMGPAYGKGFGESLPGKSLTVNHSEWPKKLHFLG